MMIFGFHRVSSFLGPGGKPKRRENRQKKHTLNSCVNWGALDNWNSDLTFNVFTYMRVWSTPHTPPSNRCLLDRVLFLLLPFCLFSLLSSFFSFCFGPINNNQQFTFIHDFMQREANKKNIATSKLWTMRRSAFITHARKNAFNQTKSACSFCAPVFLFVENHRFKIISALKRSHTHTHTLRHVYIFVISCHPQYKMKKEKGKKQSGRMRERNEWQNGEKKTIKK